MVSGNRLRIGAITNSLHGGTFTCTVTGSGVSVSGTLDLTVNGEKKYYDQSTFRICQMCATATVAPIRYGYTCCLSVGHPS